MPRAILLVSLLRMAVYFVGGVCALVMGYKLRGKKDVTTREKRSARLLIVCGWVLIILSPLILIDPLLIL